MNADINKWISEYRNLAIEYSHHERKIKTSDVIEVLIKVQ